MEFQRNPCSIKNLGHLGGGTTMITLSSVGSRADFILFTREWWVTMSLQKSSANFGVSWNNSAKQGPMKKPYMATGLDLIDATFVPSMQH